ncbi:glycosyltransferase [Streptomyces sp. NPDC006012]|uniref:glycosyltransferase n=1 Tax=Streptomyces sp. NPDC006012 TaxID=3364739 RepID=UPI0036B50E80
MASHGDLIRACPMMRDHDDFSAAAASSVVLTSDVFGQTAAPDYWNWSETAHRGVVGALLGRGTESVGRAVTQLLENPESGDLHHQLQGCIKEYLDHSNAADLFPLAEAVWSVERRSRLRFHVGPDWHSYGESVSLTDLANSCRTAESEAVDPEAAIVIPFRGSDPHSARIRNLLATLSALSQQTCARHRYRVVVVEADSEPRWQSLIEPACDVYIFAPHTGRFNKAWTTNIGVVQGATGAEAVCILDADILVNDDFVERAITRFQVAGAQAHWPFRDMLFLDARCSELAIRGRCIKREAAVPHPMMRGVYVRRPPGGCIWLRNGLFRRIGGMDERFEGWGGEDQDFEWRVDRYGSLDRHPDPIVHLDHPRMPYRADDGLPFFKEISFCSWPCESEIGDVHKYVSRP